MDIDNEDQTLSPDRSSSANTVVRLGEHVALPLIIALGLVTNAFCLKLLRRPGLRKIYIHKYITLLVTLDLLSFVFHIPRIFSHCPISNYYFAVYMTKVNWVFILFLRTISIYLLVFISYDRFLAIWINEKFQDIRDNDPFKKRMIIIFTWCFISIIPTVSMGQIRRQKDSEEDKWMSIPALKVKPDNIWGEIYGVYSGTFFVGLPVVLIIGLTAGLVLGIFLNKFSDFNEERRRTQLKKVSSVLALNTSFGLLFTPYSALLLHYNTPIDVCYRSFKYESLLFGLYCLVLLWSIFNGIIFVLLNKEYRDELKIMLKSSRFCKKCIGTDTDKHPTVTYSTFGHSNNGADIKENGIKELDSEIKQPIEDDNEPINQNTSEILDLKKQPLETDKSNKDEQGNKERASDISLNEIKSEPTETNTRQNSTHGYDVKKATDTLADAEGIKHNTSEVVDPEIKQSSDHEDDVKKAKGTQEDTNEDVEPEIKQSSRDDYDENKVKGTPEDTNEDGEPHIKQSSGHEHDVK
ncbi:unnamed protein product, partial [Meganyctiphanes norvegica]